MDERARRNRVAWEDASQKHVDEYQELLDEARLGSALFPAERELIRPLLASAPSVEGLAQVGQRTPTSEREAAAGTGPPE